MRRKDKVTVTEKKPPPNMITVLNILVELIENKEKTTRNSFQDILSTIPIKDEVKEEERVKCMGKQCQQLIKQAIYSQRFKEAAKLLWILCNDSTVHDLLLFQIGNIVLQNLDNFEDKNKAYLTFFQEAQHLNYVSSSEAQLEYLICAIGDQIGNLSKSTEGWITKKVSNSDKETKGKRKNNIFEAYTCFINYVEWKYSQAGMVSQEKLDIDLILTSFKFIVEKSGDWDIFVLKMIELLQYKNEHPIESTESKSQDSEAQIMEDKMKENLCNYAKENPEHLNAHIYLCSFLSLYEPQSELLITHLEKVAQMSPSDERVLHLVDELNGRDGYLKRCLELIFSYLDYPSNSQHVQAWLKLTELLSKSESILKDSPDKKALEETITELWSFRRKIWLCIHFDPCKVYSEKNPNLAQAKVYVLELLEKSHPFIQDILSLYR